VGWDGVGWVGLGWVMLGWVSLGFRAVPVDRLIRLVGTG